MQDFSYEKINNMSGETTKQVLRDEMLDRMNERTEGERGEEESKGSLDQFFDQKRELGLLTPYKTL